MVILISWLVHVLLVLLSVAFFTLFERKVIGLFHIRFGPNNVSFLGLLQPLLDAFKLLSNQNLVPQHSNNFVYNSAPIVALLLSVFMWGFTFVIFSFGCGSFSFIIFFCIGSIIVFSVLISGWSSNSNYSLVGSLRSVAQSISYESVFSTVIVLFLVLLSSYSIKSLSCISSLFYAPLFPVWLICSLAEGHRAPFDFSEAESELVSGFNTEYSGAYFAFIFLSEYSILLFSCVLIVWLFLGIILCINYFMLVFLSLILSFIVTWIRITFCRFRYDKLILISWNVLLPLTLMVFGFYVNLIYFIIL